MGLEALTPEEKAQLKAALDAEMGGGGDDCAAKFEAVANVLDQIVASMDAMRMDIDAVKKTVFDDMIGGIKKLYGENQRSSGIEEIKAKYGPMFDPYMDSVKEMYPDMDLHGRLYDTLSEMRGGEGYTDEMGDARVKEIADALRAKVEKIRGPAPAVAIEAAPVEAMPSEPSEMDAIVDRVKNLKKNKGRGTSVSVAE
jgi:hypothetical protein